MVRGMTLRSLTLANLLAVFAIASAGDGKDLSVYFPDYRYRESVEPKFYGTTNLILFSAVPRENGSVDFSRISPEMIAMAKRANSGAMKITFSVGGWGRGNIFGKAVDNAESRGRFVKDLLLFCEKHSLDGVDIDWEYPRTEKELSDFVLFLEALHGSLRPSGRILTVALGYTRPLSEEAYRVIDQVNLMCYQPWNPPADSYESWLESAVVQMLESGLPPEKLVIGMPFYIKEMGGKRTAYSWKKLVGDDAIAIPKSDFGYSPTGKEICDLRVAMVEKYSLGGVMVWDYGHDSTDPDHSLLRHLSGALFP